MMIFGRLAARLLWLHYHFDVQPHSVRMGYSREAVKAKARDRWLVVFDSAWPAPPSTEAAQ